MAVHCDAHTVVSSPREVLTFLYRTRELIVAILGVPLHIQKTSSSPSFVFYCSGSAALPRSL